MTGRTPELAEFHGTQRYQVLDKIGRGGMGVVYRVWDAELRREVALKTMRRPGAGEVFRIKTEFRGRSEINHPNIVDFYDLVVDDDDCFFTMELVDGADFLRWVRTRSLEALHDADTVDLDEDATRESDQVEGVGASPRQAMPRRPLGVDVDRLRDGLRQLVEGLDALHQVGCLHRDIKPGNVLVSPEGRVVLLDFGLAVALDAEDEKARIDGPVAGTAAYMSPEAIWRDGLGPPADLYSVGVMLYEALTGRRPWRGQMFEILRAKQAGQPPAPSTVTFGVPPDLEALCMDLLEPKPSARPTADQVLARLGGEVPDPAAVTLTGQLAMDMHAPFLGRAAELAALKEAFARVDAGHPTTVHVSGRSGMGKSSIIRKFLKGAEKEPHVLVLEGRCHLNETVAFKALDGVIDALSRFLMNQPTQSLMAILPSHVADLVRLFPVLGRIEGVEAAATSAGEASPDPVESRRRAFGALRDLLVRIGRRRTLVMWIDDLQWGDLDSAAILRELLYRPDPPPLLLLLSWRVEERESSPLLRVLLGEGPLALPETAVRWVDVEPLAAETGREIAQAILGADVVRHAHRLDEVLEDAGGSPFLISQLIRYIAASGERPSGDFLPIDESETSGAPSRRYLGNVVLKRVGRLSAPARDLLETISIAARPLERGLALRAAGLGASDQLLVRHLEREFLLRATRISDRIAIETYHDGIREAIVNALPDADRRRRHLALAEALMQAADPEPQALVEHFQGAGDTARAGAYAIAAADRAAEVLAFERAARLYRLALQLAPAGSDPLSLQVSLAEALSNAGQSAQAGEAFREAAQRASAAGADAVDVLRYQRQAADQYLRAGVVAEGMAALTDVLAGAGMKLPASRGGALAQILYRRAALAFRGMKFTLRRGADVPPGALVQLDAAWGATTTLSLIDPLLAGVFGVRHLRAALDLGEQQRLARALGHEASYQASIGGARGRASAASLLSTVEELGQESADPYDQGWLKLAQGTTAYLGARWSEAALCCDEGTRLFRSQCTGVNWELVSTESFAVSALAHRGDLAEVRARRRRLVQEAEERGDLFATTGFRLGILSLVDLADGEASSVRAQADALISRWPDHAFLTQHYLHLLATVAAALYEDDGADAVARIEAAWPRLRRDHFLRLQTMRVELWLLRARATLGLPPGTAGDAVVRQAIKAIRQDEDHPWARPAVAQLEAALATRGGDTQGAVEQLVRAAAGYQAADMALYAAACRYVDGTLTGDRGGEGKRQDSAGWIAAQGVADVPRMVATLVPGFGGRR